MDPVALRLGPLEIRWYGVLMATAVAVGTYLAYKEAERQRVNPDHVVNLVLLAAPLGWIGARLYFVLFQWDYYGQNLAEIPKVWHGGLAIHGGLITGVLVGWLFTRKYRLNFWQMADIIAPSVILGQAIGRWGNFFNQEAYGYPTDLPWAMYIAGEYRHPTFLYESLWNLGVFLFLLWFRRRRDRVWGEVFLAYLGLYSLGRFWVEGLRTDSLMLGPLRAAQVVSLVTIVAVLALASWRRTRAGT
ncbi:diacylglyceryl transferase [Clostridiales bacterium PH28_bin88]|nr:diacylglyceryl transferase [Clostridiales bacterium PH28_bin88]